MTTFSPRLTQSRAERLIAVGRFVLAIASLGAIYLDPLEPARYAAFTYTLLASYSAYALLAGLWTLAAATTTRNTLLASHVIDVAFFGVINYMTFGPAGPFFIFFVFNILCAMLRFGRRGTVISAGVAVAVFIATSADRIFAADFELNRFIIRLTYLFVVASMLIYLAGYQERIQRDLERIARWPRSSRGEHGTLLSQLMSEAASIFGARRVLLAYQHLSTRAAYLLDESGAVEEQPDEIAEVLLRETGTYFSSAAYPAARLDLDDSVTRRPVPRRGLPAEIEQRYSVDRVVATSFKGEFVRGRLLLLDGPPPLLEEVNLARIAGWVVSGRLDHFHAAEQLRRGAVAEERVRVARDLHDSVLQSLTGVALQLPTIPRLMARDATSAQERLVQIEQVIGSAQKELRWFIDELRPQTGIADRDLLGDRLGSLAERFREQWGLEVHNDVAPVIHLLPIATRYDIYAIVNEAVANAAKHAGAKHIAVAVDVEDSAVQIDIADDGKGFPFHGRYDLRMLTASNLGPVTLKERVSAVGGSMVLDSSDKGATLQIRMPLREAGAGS